jgi:hypothetical protein
MINAAATMIAAGMPRLRDRPAQQIKREHAYCG